MASEVDMLHYHFSISNKSCMPKRPRLTGQTQIRLLLKKQSDQGLPCRQFVDSSPGILDSSPHAELCVVISGVNGFRS